jgi:NADH dehydrogenase
MKIVIIGGGFAGINLVRHLSNKPGVEIILVDKNNYHFFPPLIYQVATCFLEASSISYPFRMFMHKIKNLRFRLGTLSKIYPLEKKVLLTTGELSYDYLVLASGTVTNFFDMKNVQENAIPMKTLDDAMSMRNILLQRLEKATVTTDELEKEKLTTVVVAGGGPTGVEISGMFAEMRSSILRNDYPELEGIKTEIYLVDGGEALLSPMSEQSQQYTYETLRKMGVRIKLKSRVSDFVDGEVIFKDGKRISSHNLIWAAGVTAQKFDGIPAESYGRGNRLLVNEFNEVSGMSSVYAIGDTCIQTSDPAFPEGHPQVAQVALQQGINLADNFLKILNNISLKSFRYKDKGSMAIIGKSKAVADLPKPKVHFKGFFAWAAWLFIHLLSLIHYRNRIKTLYNWFIAYLKNDQSLRMIFRPKNY